MWKDLKKRKDLIDRLNRMPGSGDIDNMVLTRVVPRVVTFLFHWVEYQNFIAELGAVI